MQVTAVRRRAWRTAFALALSCGMLAPAVHAQPPGGDATGLDPEGVMLAFHRARTASLVQALVQEGSARGLAYAALLDGADRSARRLTVHGPEAAAWRVLALQRAGTDTVALALLAASTKDSAGIQAAARWRELAPDNLVAMLYAGLEPDALRAAAAKATHARTHAVDQLRWIVDVARRFPPEGLHPAAVASEGGSLLEALAIVDGWAILAAGVMPLQGLMAGCRDAGARGGLAADECARIARVLQSGDTRLLESIGHAIAVEAAGDPDARQAADAARRNFDWQLTALAQWSQAQADDGLAGHVAALLDPAHATEGAMHRAQLRHAGIALEPPPDWRPSAR